VSTVSSFVSVILPVYNGELYLADAIKSILGQTRAASEIIVVDDGSTDRTREIATSFGETVRYAFQSNCGPPAARNTGLEHARGDVIGFLDADDLWLEDKLERQLGILTDQPAVDVVVGFTQAMRTSEDHPEKRLPEFFGEAWPALNLGSTLFRRHVFTKVGLFDDSSAFCDDWDWFMRAREMGTLIAVDPQVVRLYRRHDHNLTRDVEVTNHHALRTLKKSLDRRRKSNGGRATSLPSMSGGAC